MARYAKKTKHPLQKWKPNENRLSKQANQKLESILKKIVRQRKIQSFGGWPRRQKVVEDFLKGLHGRQFPPLTLFEFNSEGRRFIAMGDMSLPHVNSVNNVSSEQELNHTVSQFGEGFERHDKRLPPLEEETVEMEDEHEEDDYDFGAAGGKMKPVSIPPEIGPEDSQVDLTSYDYHPPPPRACYRKSPVPHHLLTPSVSGMSLTSAERPMVRQPSSTPEDSSEDECPPARPPPNSFKMCASLQVEDERSWLRYRVEKLSRAQCILFCILGHLVLTPEEMGGPREGVPPAEDARQALLSLTVGSHWDLFNLAMLFKQQEKIDEVLDMLGVLNDPTLYPRRRITALIVSHVNLPNML